MMFGRRRRQAPPRPPSQPSPPPDEVFLGGEPTPFSANDIARKKRNDAAASLVDEETYGYLLLRLKKMPKAKTGRIDIAAHIEPQWRRAFAKALKKVIDYGF